MQAEERLLRGKRDAFDAEADCEKNKSNESTFIINDSPKCMKLSLAMSIQDKKEKYQNLWIFFSNLCQESFLKDSENYYITSLLDAGD